MGENALRTTRGRVLAGLVAALLAAVGLVVDAEAQAPSALARIQKAGVLRIGYIPTLTSARKDPNTGKLTGYSIWIAEQLARDMKVKVEFIESGWSTFVAGLQAGQFDACFGPTFVTGQRAIAVDFSVPVVYLGHRGIVRKGDTRFNSPDDVNRKGVKVAVSQGTAVHEYVREAWPQVEVVAVQSADITQPGLEVLARRADVWLEDSANIDKFAKAHAGEVAVVFADHHFLFSPVGFTVRKGDPEWLNYLNTLLNVYISRGLMRAWMERAEMKGAAVERRALEIIK